MSIKYDYKKLYLTQRESNKALINSIRKLESEKKELQKILYSRDEKRDAFFTEISKELELLRIIKKLTEKII